MVKKQCMHCNEPACAAACLTQAMYKTKEGPVIWRGDKCMGCRYCMVSCPFDIPKFEYHSANPKIQKCDLCYDRIIKGEIPACVEICGEALTFGTRRELIAKPEKELQKIRTIMLIRFMVKMWPEVQDSCIFHRFLLMSWDLILTFRIHHIRHCQKDFFTAFLLFLFFCRHSYWEYMKQLKITNLKKKKMNNTANTIAKDNDGKSIWRFLLSELKPKGKWLTPFNIISIPVILLGLVLIVIRFWKGIGSITNLSQEVPWGLWIGFDVVTGVAFAGGAYVITFMVYILKMNKYHSIVRITVLNGFLAYVFYAGALLLDLGRPWNVINPIIGNSFGTSSVLFLVAWHFLLYMIAELIEFSPAIAEWLGARRARKILSGMTIAAVIFGITLSTLHQSGLGALFLMAKDKIHPLWYSEFIPILFLVSSIFAGLSMVIFEGSISHKVFFDQISEKNHKAQNGIIHGLSKICAGTMFAYFFLQLLVFIHGKRWDLLNTPMGYWFLLEMIGFVLIPMLLFFYSYRRRNIFMITTCSHTDNAGSYPEQA